jgi:23S rRNA pseudouridine1911/1915/1917 synthase
MEEHCGWENGGGDSAGTEEGDEDSSDFRSRSGLVHRLDKETSGVLILAKNEEVFLQMQAQFKNREVSKTYKALAHGRVSPPTGEINVPVGRLPWNRRQFGVVAGGKEAQTHYKVISYYRSNDKKRESLTLLELHPVTGRTHQIRVHLQYLGHPIFADFLYAGRKVQRDDRALLARVFLHAAHIIFTHPVTKERMSLEAPFPPELQSVMDHMVPTV